MVTTPEAPPQAPNQIPSPPAQISLASGEMAVLQTFSEKPVLSVQERISGGYRILGNCRATDGSIKRVARGRSFSYFRPSSADATFDYTHLTQDLYQPGLTSIVERTERRLIRDFVFGKVNCPLDKAHIAGAKFRYVAMKKSSSLTKTNTETAIYKTGENSAIRCIQFSGKASLHVARSFNKPKYLQRFVLWSYFPNKLGVDVKNADTVASTNDLINRATASRDFNIDHGVSRIVACPTVPS